MVSSEAGNRSPHRFSLPRRRGLPTIAVDTPAPGFDRHLFPARCLHAGFVMQPIIRQNAIGLALPDLRNLGTILRIVLAVNAMTAVAALVREPQFELWTAAWLDMTAVVEPHLIVELAILYALAPWLSRQTAPTGALVIAAITVVVGIGLHALIGRAVSGCAARCSCGTSCSRSVSTACCSSISISARRRCRRRSPNRGCRRCRPGSARTSCSTASMRCCRWCAPTRSGPRPRSSTWPTSFAC